MSLKELNSENTSLLLDVEGMKCGGCVRTVEKTLLSQANIQNASVNLVTRTAWIDLEDQNISIEPILKALNERGFPSKKRDNSNLQESSKSNIGANKAWWNQWRQLLIAIVLLLLSVLGHLAESGQIQIPLLGSLTFHASLATFALFGPGLSILKSGAKSALALNPSMDTLVGLGVSSAYLTSLIALAWPQVGFPCFFNEPVMLLGFVLLGRFLEERARYRTGKAIEQLAKLQPDTARLYVNENEIKEIRVGALRPGEKLQLLAGDRVPVDGTVIDGHSAVDISSLTGEPLPIEASQGTHLSAGSLNLEGTLILEIKNVGAQTALARIISLVEEAQARKAPIQGIADRIAGKFCYGVVTLSIMTFLFWWQIGTKLWPEVISQSDLPLLSLHNHNLHSSLGVGAQTSIGLALQLSIAVLVVACPCALGLATPTVITVASGQAAKNGWLFRGGDIIEKASLITEIIFDKTGTLTIGKPSVIGFSETNDAPRMFKLAASLEQNSRHPIAHAILKETEDLNINLIEAVDTITFPGKGLSGNLNGIQNTIRVGTPEWLNSQDIKWNKALNNEISLKSNLGYSIVGVAEGYELLGFIFISDKVRPNIDLALEKLRRSKISLSLFSGDRKEAVQKLGKELGFHLNQLHWQLLPDEKLEKLKELKRNKSVAMVGDGINDAPALAEADLGIAVSTGTQIAQEAADLILLGDRLDCLPEALLLARDAMNKIKQNLIWAFGYNLIALPIAAGALLPSQGMLLSPPIAALLMAMSSITVVINALSLRSP